MADYLVFTLAASLGATSNLCRGDFLFFDSNNAYRWGVYSRSGGTDNGTTSINSLTAGWHHLAVVANGAESGLHEFTPPGGVVPGPPRRAAIHRDRHV